MVLTQKEAAASLDLVAATQRRARQIIQYDMSSSIFILWGVLWAVGYGLEYLRSVPSGLAWFIVDGVGLAGTVVLIVQKRAKGGVTARDRRLALAFLCLLGYGAIWSILLGSFNQRQMDAFWPTLVMCAYILGGIWLGRFFVVLGVILTVLVLIGYFALGAWFELWMMVVGGAGLIVGGLWLRRLGEPSADAQ
jgi:hypothetical protein